MKCGGITRETDFHMFRECPDNCNVSLYPEIIDKTRYMVGAAKRQFPDLDIFWCRGIPIQSFYEVSPPLELCTISDIGLIDVEAFIDFQLSFYSDGSGGKHSQTPELRRCGFSWLQLLPDWSPARIRFGGIPGCRQTVPRAETYALLDLLQTLDKVPVSVTSHILLMVDASYVSKIATSLLQRLRCERSGALTMKAMAHPCFVSGNSDIWTQILPHLRIRCGFISVRWCKSHASEYMLLAGYISKQDFTGNALADSFADEGAKSVEISIDDADTFKFYKDRSFNVRKRLICILDRVQKFDDLNSQTDSVNNADNPAATSASNRSHFLPLVVRSVRNKRLTQEHLLQVASVLKHDIVFHQTLVGSVFRCKLCRKHCSLAKAREFLKESQCNALVISPQRILRFSSHTSKRSHDEIVSFSQNDVVSECASQTHDVDRHMQSLPSKPPVVGRRSLYASHTLLFDRGVIICGTCGRYCISKPEGLDKPCDNKLNSGGKLRLIRRERGLMPITGSHWPEPNTAQPSGCIWMPNHQLRLPA